MSERVFIALGSNVGDKGGNLDKALYLLSGSGRAKTVKASPRYLTRPWGGPEQEDYLNMALEIRTRLNPVWLLGLLKDIEKEMGREDAPPDHPRVIDLDIVFYGGLVADLEGVTLPHPRAHERLFVMAPVNDIAPDFVHPVSGEKVSSIFERLEKEYDGTVRKT